MKIKIKKEVSYKHSILAKRFEETFKNSGIGLNLSHEIYNIKLNKQNKDEIGFQEFIESFYAPEENTEYPHYLPIPTEIYYGDTKKAYRNFNAKNTNEYLNQLSEAVLYSPSTLNLMIGDSGAGKTSTFMAIVKKP